MRDYAWMYKYCLNRFGLREALKAHPPQPKDVAELRMVGDDRYLSLISPWIPRAGFKHSLVDAKWPALGEVSFGLDSQKVVLMSAEYLERLMWDARPIRHPGKLKSVPRNTQMVLDLARERGNFGNFPVDWLETDIVGLRKLLSRRDNQFGDLSTPRFPRITGRDIFIPSDDMVATLETQRTIDRPPISLKDLTAVQGTFSQRREESGWPLCQLSVILVHTVNH